MKKSILITGCSSGIGQDAAITLHKQGWRVFATCRKQSDCDALIAQGLESFVLDYESSDSVQAGAAEALNRTGGTLDAIFNNGAYAIPGCTEDLSRDALRTLFEANFLGPFELINALIPAMRKQGHGHIINCSSVLGFAAMPFRGAYNSTKFAMEGLSDTLRLELNNSGIHVVLIEPGPITTKIRKNSQQPFEQWIDYKASAQKEMYEKVLNPRLYAEDGKPDKFELPPSAVTNTLIKALNSDNPNPRYYVTIPTHIAGILKRVCSTRMLDKIFLRRYSDTKATGN